MRKVIQNDIEVIDDTEIIVQVLTMFDNSMDPIVFIYDEKIHGTLSQENEAKIGGLYRDSNENLQFDQNMFNEQYQMLLTKAKDTKINEIKVKTLSLLQEGFLYDNNYFKLDTDSLTLWIGINIEVNSNTENFPRPIFTREGNPYMIMNKDSWISFWSTGKLALDAIKMGGGSLELAVKTATTFEELELITDDR